MAKRKRRKKKVRIIVPKSYIHIDKISRTRYLQNPKTGKMMGRTRTRAPGDATRVRRVKRGQWSGIILGRRPAIKVRASKKKRGHVRVRL